MYDELIKMLRTCSERDSCIGWEKACPYLRTGVCNNKAEKAADAIEELQKAVVRLEDESGLYDELPTFYIYPTKWIPVTERLPENGTHVLASCRTFFNNYGYVCDAFYVAPKSMEVSYYDDYPCDCETEYDEEEDKYFLVSGWYEVIKNWDDYNSIAIEDKVTHWMPLPEPPESDGK